MTLPRCAATAPRRPDPRRLNLDIAELREQMHREIAALDEKLSRRIAALDEKLSRDIAALGERIARHEGFMEGIRDAIAGKTA